MTYSKPWLAAFILLAACDLPSTNVGEVPTTTEATTDVDPETGTATDTGASTEPGGTETGTSMGAEETTAAPESSGGTETGGEDGCLDEVYECFGGAHEPLDCGGESVCEVLEVNDPTLNDIDREPFGFVNPEAATCILEGLAAGTVGVYEIEVEPGQQYSISHRLELLADGSLLLRSHSQEDKGCDGHERRLERRAADYFEACQQETDEALILECVLGAGDPALCVPQGNACP